MSTNLVFNIVQFNLIQWCIKYVIKSVGEEYQVVKWERDYHGFVEENNVEKRERGSNFIFPMTLRLLGRILSMEGDRNWKKNKWVGKNIKL